MTASYAIDGYPFGQRRSDVKSTGQGIIVAKTTIDPGSPTTNDVAVVGQNGRAMGRDYLPGMSLTFEGSVVAKADPDGATARYSELASAWNQYDVMTTPGMYNELVMKYPYTNRQVMVYGRGRQISPTLGDVRKGILGFVAQFDCVDNTFYDALESSFEIGLIPVDTGGFIPPFIPPVILGSTSESDYTAINGGVRTYPILELKGPVVQPKILYPNRGVALTLDASIPAGVIVTLDTRPWKMSITDSAGGSYAGKLKGGRLVDLVLPPGETLVAYNGQDLTGVTRLRFRWRKGTPMLGGI